MNIDVKIFNRLLPNHMQQNIYIKNIASWPSGFNPGMYNWYDIQESITVIHHINQSIKKYSYDHLNRCIKKAFNW